MSVDAVEITETAVRAIAGTLIAFGAEEEGNAVGAVVESAGDIVSSVVPSDPIDPWGLANAIEDAALGALRALNQGAVASWIALLLEATKLWLAGQLTQALATDGDVVGEVDLT